MHLGAAAPMRWWAPPATGIALVLAGLAQAGALAWPRRAAVVAAHSLARGFHCPAAAQPQRQQRLAAQRHLRHRLAGGYLLVAVHLHAPVRRPGRAAGRSGGAGAGAVSGQLLRLRRLALLANLPRKAHGASASSSFFHSMLAAG